VNGIDLFNFLILSNKTVAMKNFMKTYFSNDGAGAFALMWVICVITFITLLVSNG
jgi:hypothetical protein